MTTSIPPSTYIMQYIHMRYVHAYTKHDSIHTLDGVLLIAFDMPGFYQFILIKYSSRKRGEGVGSS